MAAARDAAKALKEWERDAIGSYRAAERAQAKIAKEAEHAGLKTAAATAKMLGSVTKTAHGVEQLARGFVLLGVASEDDLQKAVHAMAAFEGGLEVLKGTATVLKSVTGGWRAYTSAVVLAAAAEKARAAAGIGGAAASGVGSVAAGGVGAAAAGGGLATGAIGA